MPFLVIASDSFFDESGQINLSILNECARFAVRTYPKEFCQSTFIDDLRERHKHGPFYLAFMRDENNHAIMALACFRKIVRTRAKESEAQPYAELSYCLTDEAYRDKGVNVLLNRTFAQLGLRGVLTTKQLKHVNELSECLGEGYRISGVRFHQEFSEPPMSELTLFQQIYRLGQQDRNLIKKIAVLEAARVQLEEDFQHCLNTAATKIQALARGYTVRQRFFAQKKPELSVKDEANKTLTFRSQSAV